MSAEEYLSARQARINHLLSRQLPDPKREPCLLHQAMHYAVLNGGKRLRPLLVYATGETMGASLEQLDNAACAVELIHAYSLIHDDLPAMDNDDFRRGQPTCHKAFNEATAILAGDALQTLGFEILSKDGVNPQQCLQMIASLASACSDMVAGQAMELSLPPDQINIAQLETIHSLKTGALMRASVRLGALIAQASGPALAQLDNYANHLGLAYQIQDDVQDNPTTPNQTTANYVSHLGLTDAQQKIHSLYQAALQNIESFAEQAAPLHYLAAFMLGHPLGVPTII